ncbi:MAG: histidine--tRNA ligase [Candidatus Sericytochromatia bacterium]|nr:histidine--tRNA ligase [Candidatus Sericytochromatia bacterium]
MTQKIAAPRGTHDTLPPDERLVALVEETAARLFARHGLREIRTPIFEATELFARGVGTETDMVAKEMYTFTDRGDRSLTLRPEGTAGVVRAYVEGRLDQALPQPARLWYGGPMFRYERPQKGRQRQFHQIGVEVLGSSSPAVDAEMIVLAHDLQHDLLDAACAWLRDCGVAVPDGLRPMPLEVRINSLGDAACRPAYREALQEWLRQGAGTYCADCLRRTESNPLRVLDCKVPACRARNAGAPRLQPCASCLDHAAQVREMLEAADVRVVEDPALVRGLDYYSRTVFEMVPAGGGEAAQATVCAGGRYDGLVAELGGADTPAFGWALGLERTVQRLEALLADLSPEDRSRLRADRPALFMGALEPRALVEVFRMGVALRRQGFSVQWLPVAAKPDRILKAAVRADARQLLLVGSDELDSGRARLKDLATREQRDVNLVAVDLGACLKSAGPGLAS